MIITFLILLLKSLALVLISALFPLQFFNFILPPLSLDPIITILNRILSLFLWLFGRPAYSFFIVTVIATMFAVPVYKLSLFLLHFINRLKGFFR
mgnify:CR=1 FL=1